MTQNSQRKIESIVDHWISGTLDQCKSRGSIFAREISRSFTHNLTLKFTFIERIRSLELKEAVRSWYYSRTQQFRNELHFDDLVQRAEAIEENLENTSDDDIPSDID